MSVTSGVHNNEGQATIFALQGKLAIQVHTNHGERAILHLSPDQAITLGSLLVKKGAYQLEWDRLHDGLDDPTVAF